MALSGISKTRMLIVTVITGAVLLTLLKFLYPQISLSHTWELVTVISIIIAFIVEMILGSRESGGKKS